MTASCHAAEDPPGNHLRQVAESLQTRGFDIGTFAKASSQFRAKSWSEAYRSFTYSCTAHPAIARSTNITASLPGETYGMDPLV